MDINYINNRINSEICHIILESLLDINLLDDYKKSKSVVSQVNILKTVLLKHNCSDEVINNIINDYIIHLIPAGTKGVIRGLKFNSYIKNYIIELNLDNNEYEIQFEKECKYSKTCLEKPDWFIYHKNSGKLLIGMNQLDLWSGGHQVNRGNKYILANSPDTTCKLVCVICNKIQFKKINKVYKIFEYGFKNETLCYINNLKCIIFKYFNLIDD